MTLRKPLDPDREALGRRLPFHGEEFKLHVRVACCDEHGYLNEAEPFQAKSVEGPGDGNYASFYVRDMYVSPIYGLCVLNLNPTGFQVRKQSFKLFA